jgi:hypothetical protein
MMSRAATTIVNSFGTGRPRKIAGLTARAQMAGVGSVEYAESKNYDQIARGRLFDDMLRKAEELLPGVENPKELQQLAGAVALLDDRKRLAEGEATSRHELVSGDTARARVLARLEAMAQVIDGSARDRQIGAGGDEVTHE